MMRAREGSSLIENQPRHRRLAARGVLLAGALILGAVSVPAAAADLASGKALYASCVACHGAAGAGNGQVGAPNLTGQQATYLTRQIHAFIEGRRGAQAGDTFGAQMQSVTQVFQGDDDITDVAAYLASLPAERAAAVATGPKVDLSVGRNYFNGICSSCHGTDGRGNVALSAPRLAGQDAAYLMRQYAQFKSGQRGGDGADTYGQQMTSIVRALPDAATEQAVLAYAASLGS